MRILHVTHFMDQGGSESMILQLAGEQKRLGHDVEIATIFGEGPLDTRVRELGIPLHHLRCGQSRLKKIKALHSFLGTRRFDVLHSHWGSWLAVAIAGFLRRVPRVHTNHSNQRRLWFLEHRVASLFTSRVVVLTPFVEPYIARWVGVPKRKIEVIPNGTDLNVLEHAQRVEIPGIPPEAPVVAMVARLSPPKDQPTFMRAAKIVGEIRPEVRFLCVGTGQRAEELRREAEGLGLNNFDFLGGRNDVPSLLRRTTISVLCTRHEGHPMSLVEALASGVPSIGTDIPSLRYVLDDGRAGLLVPPNDPETLARTIVALLDDAPLRTRLSQHGRSYAQQFGSEQMAKRYLALYVKLLLQSHG